MNPQTLQSLAALFASMAAFLGGMYLVVTRPLLKHIEAGREDLKKIEQDLKEDLKEFKEDLTEDLKEIKASLKTIDNRLTALEKKVDALEIKAWAGR